jgi:hypothetical protein
MLRSGLRSWWIPLALAASSIEQASGQQPASGSLIAATSDGQLYLVSPTTATPTLIGSTGFSFEALEYAPNGTLYGVSGDSLYTINPNTGASVRVSTLGLPVRSLAFAPNGTAYATGRVPGAPGVGGLGEETQLFTIDITTGASTVIGPITSVPHGSPTTVHFITGLAFRATDGKLIGLNGDNRLLVIDPATAAATTLAQLPAAVGNNGGMTMMNGAGYLNTAGPGTGPFPMFAGSNELYSFSLQTGAATRIGSFGPTITGHGVSALAAAYDRGSPAAPPTSALRSAGSMPRLASGGAWKTTFTLVNTGAASAQASLNFFDEMGRALSLPVAAANTSAGPGTRTYSSYATTLAPGGSVVLDTGGGSVVQTGWAQLLTDGAVSGFTMFSQTVGNSVQEAVVPLESRNARAFVLPFDNVGSSIAIALTNVSPRSGGIALVIKDESGAVQLTDTLTLPAQGHTAFVLGSRYPATVLRRGTVEITAAQRVPAAVEISVIGLRFNATGAFTTIPVFASQ